MSKIDLTSIGKTYNYLTVISYEKRLDKNGTKSKWFLCKCVCGNKKFIRSANVLDGGIKSCGCKRRELINAGTKAHYLKNFSYPAEKKIYSNYKVDSKRNGREFTLTFEVFLKIVNKNCYYCGSNPVNKIYNKTKNRFAVINGIDRVDSSKGYIKNNIVPCCSMCNMMKNKYPAKVFIKQVKKIATHNSLC